MICVVFSAVVCGSMRCVDLAVLHTDDGVSLLSGDDVLDFQPSRILRGVYSEEKGED